MERLRTLGLVPGQDDSEDDTSEEEDEDPGAGEPGARLLWAAQHNHLELATQLLDSDPDLVTFR